MKTDVRLSTKFTSTQNAHQVGMLVTLAGEMRVRRAPINVSLVLDRSGSMHGAPLAAAREAASRFVSFLSPEDRLSIVVFDTRVETIFGPAPAVDPLGALDVISRIREGGSTNLSGGWLAGARHVREHLVEGTNRVVLLTDGQANAGIVDPVKLAGLAADALGGRISSTCIGFGPHFNEDLLAAMSRAGGGNWWYVEQDDQMAAIFDQEIQGLVALAAQNVAVQVRLTHPKAAGVSFLQSYPVTRSGEDTWSVQLHDLYATSDKSLGLVFHVEQVEELGRVLLGEVKVEGDVVTEEGIEHRIVTMPVWANLDGADHPEPVVERTLLRFEVARAREDAVRRADEGDFPGAAHCLREASARLVREGGEDAEEEIEDLEAEARRMEDRLYEARDRKYNSARAMAAMESKMAYVERVRRREGK